MRSKPGARRIEREGSLSEAKASSLTPAPASSALLAAFRALSVNDLYTMAPKESVVRGYDYYRQQRLQHYVWSQAGDTLTAEVQGTRLYEVNFSLDDGFLSVGRLEVARLDNDPNFPERGIFNLTVEGGK